MRLMKTIGMLSAMQTFGDQSSLAMNNARLFREVEQKGAGTCAGEPAQITIFRQYES
jgi:hypothetical protein